MTYERARERMASVLSVSPKKVGIVGSARLGYSLGTKFGAPYGATSDLDMFVVSYRLFGELAKDGLLFASRVRSGEAVPNTEQERRWWEDTASKMDVQVYELHYLDHKLIPIRDRYPVVRQISHAMVQFKRSLAYYSSDQRDWRMSVRVYRDWEAAIRKIGGSLCRQLLEQGFRLVD